MKQQSLSRLICAAALTLASCCAFGMTALAEKESPSNLTEPVVAPVLEQPIDTILSEVAAPETPNEETQKEPETSIESAPAAEDAIIAPEETSKPVSADKESSAPADEDSVPAGYTGLYMYQGAWRYFTDGVLDYNYTGVAEAHTPNTVERYYVKGSCIDPTFTGLGLGCENGNWIWFYFVNGYNDTRVSDILVYFPVNGWKYYITNGRIDGTYTGLKMYGNEWYYVRKGTVCPWDILNGVVVEHVNGWHYYVNNNAIDHSVGGVNGALVWGVDYSDPKIPDNQRVSRMYLMYQGTCNPVDCFFKHADGYEYFMKKGVWVGSDYTGLVQQGNTTYLVQFGAKNLKYNGVYNFNRTLYKITNGIVDTGFTGVFFQGSNGYYFKNGILDSSFNGTIPFSGGTYTVKNGVVSSTNRYGSPDADEHMIFEEVKEQRKMNGNWVDPSYSYKFHNAAETLAKEQSVRKGGTRPNGKSWTTVLEEHGWSSEKAGRSAGMLYINASTSVTDTQLVKLLMDNANFASQIKNKKYNSISVGRYVTGGMQYVVILMMDL